MDRLDGWVKQGAKVVETPWYYPGRLAANTVGRPAGAVTQLLMNPTHPASAVFGWPTRDLVDDDVRMMDEQYPEELKDTEVRLGGTNTLNDIGRIWTNKRTTVPGKLVGTAATPIGNLFMTLGRGDFYNPYADTVNLFGTKPGMVAHELGHAADFNSGKSRILRDLYTLGRGPDAALARIATGGSAPGPLSLWQELAANRKALHAAGANDDDGTRSARVWSAAAPSYGSYAGAALGGLASAFRHPIPFTADNPGLNAALTVLTGGVGGALGGHVLAAVRNHLAAGKQRHQEKEPVSAHSKEGSAVYDLIDRALAKRAADLSPGSPARKHVPKKDFVYKRKKPEGSSKKDPKGSYPVPDKAHARAALGFAAMHHGKGSATYQAVARKVHAKFPDMGKKGAEEHHKGHDDNPYPGIAAQFGLQRRLPIGAKRPFTPEEEQAVEEGESRWLPRIFTSYGTPVHEELSSPARGALLGGGLGGLAGGALGYSAGNTLRKALEGATAHMINNGVRTEVDPEVLHQVGQAAPWIGGLGGLALGVLPGAVAMYWGRQARNEGIKDVMRRLPPGATRRDMLSDPVVGESGNISGTTDSGWSSALARAAMEGAIRAQYRM